MPAATLPAGPAPRHPARYCRGMRAELVGMLVVNIDALARLILPMRDAARLPSEVMRVAASQSRAGLRASIQRGADPRWAAMSASRPQCAASLALAATTAQHPAWQYRKASTVTISPTSSNPASRSHSAGTGSHGSGRSERDVQVPIYVPFGSIRYVRFGSIGLNVAVQALLVGRATPARSAVILLAVGTLDPMGAALVAALACATGSAGAGAGRAHAAVSVLPDALGAKTVLSGCWLVTCRS